MGRADEIISDPQAFAGLFEQQMPQPDNYADFDAFEDEQMDMLAGQFSAFDQPGFE